MNDDYKRIEQAIRYIRANVTTQPGLEEIAAYTGLSPFHFQRLFRRWAGVSPKRFLEYLTVNYAKERLKEANNILDVSYDAGLTSAGRLHDHFVSIEAVSPGEYKRQGKGVEIHYGIHDSPFGPMFLALTNRGICALSFINEETTKTEISKLQKSWPQANIIKDPKMTAVTAEKIFNRSKAQDAMIHLTVRGTNFQINVWKALLNIPMGCIISYRQLAGQIGKPDAPRAVAKAIATNPIGYLIPCHRVLRNNGEISGYHWGIERKQAILAWEAAKKENHG